VTEVLGNHRLIGWHCKNGQYLWLEPQTLAAER